MQFVRYAYEADVGTGLVDAGTVYRVNGSIFGDWQRGDRVAPLADVRLLAPAEPTKIVCVGRNYAAHAAEQNADVPDEPILFLKPTSSLVGPDADVVLPELSRRVEHEAELTVVIGTRCRHVTVDDAWRVVFGYTCGNDVTARDLQRRDGQWTRGKAFDTFCPVGPAIVTDFDPTDVDLICRVNGEVRQQANTRDMVFSIPELIAAVTAVMTLEPGDLLLTGTPDGVSPLHPDDVVEVEVTGLGVLRNRVVGDRERV